MGVSKTGNPWIVNALGCTLCRMALCLVTALYAVSYGCTPCCLAPRHIKLTTGDRSCRLVAGLSFGPRFAVHVVAWPFSLILGALFLALG